MKTRTLTAGVEIPYLGFGTYLIADDEVVTAVSEAIRAGYRHIDTAEGYQNESGVGAGIKQALESEGLAEKRSLRHHEALAREPSVGAAGEDHRGHGDIARREPRTAGARLRGP